MMMKRNGGERERLHWGEKRMKWKRKSVRRTEIDDGHVASQTLIFYLSWAAAESDSTEEMWCREKRKEKEGSRIKEEEMREKCKMKKEEVEREKKRIERYWCETRRAIKLSLSFIFHFPAAALLTDPLLYVVFYFIYIFKQFILLPSSSTLSRILCI